MNITFITSNASKAEQLGKYLGTPVGHQNVDLPEIQSLSLSEVIEHKARAAYEVIKCPVIVDDVALTIHELGKLPGPFIKFFIGEIGNEGICNLVEHLKNKSAQAEVCIGFFDGEHLEVASGIIDGSIASSPKGDRGFGWDAIFIPDGYTETRGAMSEEDYDATSPRKFALEKLDRYIKSI